MVNRTIPTFFIVETFQLHKHKLHNILCDNVLRDYGTILLKQNRLKIIVRNCFNCDNIVIYQMAIKL
jgi:hypothetical protein